MRKRILALAAIMLIAFIWLVAYASGTFICDRCGHRISGEPVIFVQNERAMHVCADCNAVLGEIARLGKSTVVFSN